MENAQEGSSSGTKNTRKRSGGKPTFQQIALQFIRQDGTSGYCQIDKASHCKFFQTTVDVGNMIRHFRNRHPEAANRNGLLADENMPEKKSRTICKCSVAIDRQLLLEAIVKLVSYNHLPLACVEWEGMKQILDPLAQALKVTINKSKLKCHLEAIAQKIRVALAKEMACKLISLKIDSASRMNRHVLGINVQYAVDGQVVIRTIGMIELKERQTAVFLKSKIIEVLASYGVSIEQIFSVTVDNGANMLSAVRKLKLDLDNMLTNQSEEFRMLMETYVDTANEDCEDIEEKEDCDVELMDGLTAQFQEHLNLIRCSVHTLQLAINDVINKSDESVKEITAVAKKCKAVKYKTHFEYHTASLPPVWCQTRWGGVYVMMQSFLTQKEFFEKLGHEFLELQLSTNNWNFISNYVQAFKPLYVCTKKMQERHVSLPDFYLEWLMAVSEIRKNQTNPFSSRLVESLTRRLDNLKASRAFQMALYLDPRFNYLNSKLFNHEEKLMIQSYIKETWDRIKKLRPSTEVDMKKSCNSESCSQYDDLITDLFGGMPTEPSSSNPYTFAQQLKAQDAEPRQGTNQDVWQFWLKREKSHPELFAVAMVALAAPSNQVSVERAFSALALVLSPHRAGLSHEALENILLVKLNRDIFEKEVPMYDWKD